MTKNHTAPNIPLFDEYRKRCEENLTAGPASDYPSRLKKIVREFISKIKTGSKKTPMKLLEEALSPSSSENGPKKKLIGKILDALKYRVSVEYKAIQDKKAKNDFGCSATAFRKYIEVVEDYVETRNHRNTQLTLIEKELIFRLRNENIVISKNELIRHFANRVNTQDRVSGDKPFLPLGLLDKMSMSKDKSAWKNGEVKRIILHTKGGLSFKVDEIESLTINIVSGEVSLLREGQLYIVCEPPLDNEVETPMKLNSIADTDIDHQPEIDTVLKSLKGKVPALEILTIEIKNAMHRLGFSKIIIKGNKGNKANLDKIYDEVIAKGIYKPLKPILFKDLETVSSKHGLQLSSSDWNRRLKKLANKRKHV